MPGGPGLAVWPLLLLCVLLSAAGCDGGKAGGGDTAPDACVAVCGAGSSGQSDGCGSVCPESFELSCADCPLRLVRLGQAGGVVTLAVESSAVDGAPLPRLAELVIKADRAVTLQDVAVGPALARSKKRLHRFTHTNLNFETVDDRSHRILVFSGTEHLDVPAGRWLTLRYVVTGDAQPGDRAAFQLVRERQVLAPGGAAAALLATPFDAPVSVPLGEG